MIQAFQGCKNCGSVMHRSSECDDVKPSSATDDARIPVLYRNGDGHWIMLGDNGEKFEVAMRDSPLERAMTAALSTRSEIAMHQVLPLAPQPETTLTTNACCTGLPRSLDCKLCPTDPEKASRSSVVANEGETPRTDALLEAHGGKNMVRESAYWLALDHARQLERELADARMDFEGRKASEEGAVMEANRLLEELNALRSATAAIPTKPVWSGGNKYQAGFHDGWSACVDEMKRGVSREESKWTG